MSQLDPSDYSAFLLPLLLESQTWVLRRVEQVDWPDDETVSVHVSMDFDLRLCGEAGSYTDLALDGFLPLLLVPIGFLEKAPLVDFDLRDAKGAALSLLSERETTPLAAALLRDRADIVVGVDAARTFQGELDALVSCAGGDAARAWRAFRVRPPGRRGSDVKALLLNDPLFAYMAETLTSRFLALAVVDPEQFSARAMLKYSYSSRLEWKADLSRRLGWWPVELRLELALVRLSASYHVEVTAPEGLQIRRLRVDRRIRGQAEPRDILQPPVKGHLARAHAHFRSGPFAEEANYRLAIRLAPLRRGLVRSALTASLLAFLALGLCFLFHQRIADRSLTAVASTLLVVPGLLATYVARPAEHPLTTRLCLAVRVAVLVGCALPCFVAASLIALQVSADVLAYWAGLLLLLVLTSTLALLQTFLVAGRAQ